MTPRLLPHHANELMSGSGIDPNIVATRGYRSVTAEEVATLGFASSQCREGLAIPQWTLAGVQVGWLLKPTPPVSMNAARRKSTRHRHSPHRIWTYTPTLAIFCTIPRSRSTYGRQ